MSKLSNVTVSLKFVNLFLWKSTEASDWIHILSFLRLAIESVNLLLT